MKNRGALGSSGMEIAFLLHKWHPSCYSCQRSEGAS